MTIIYYLLKMVMFILYYLYSNIRLYIVGGGGCLVKHFGQYDESRVTILDDICATAKGYEYLAFTSLRRKE